MKRIVQKRRFDCGGAALAMLTGQSYKKAMKMRHWYGKGMHIVEAYQCLKQNGFRPRILGTRPRGKGLYMVNIRRYDSQTGEVIGGHWTVWDGQTQRFYDPGKGCSGTKTWKDYDRIDWKFVGAIRLSGNTKSRAK